MAVLRSALYALLFYSIGSLIIIIAMIAAWIGQDQVIWAARRWARWHRWCARWALGIRLEVQGNLDQGQALYVLKHESAFETFETLAAFDRPVVVMKEELLDLPFWGFASRRHGSIGVNRDAGPTAMRAMIAAAKTAKASGRPILLFPEGTRVGVGEAPELKAGLAGLYKILGLPVIPVAIRAGHVWPKGFVKHPGTVTFRVGETIPPGLPREEIESRVHAAINVLNGV